MSHSKFVQYVEILSQLFADNKISAKWGKNTILYRSRINLEEELRDIDSTYSEEEFVEVVFSVLRIVRDLSQGLTPADEFKTDIVKDKFLKENDILDYVRVHTTSIVNTVEELDYEISTKRSKKDPDLVIGKSGILNITYTNPMEPDTNKLFSLELSVKELENIKKEIESMLETIEKIDRLEVK